jgi:hypothetical protein
VFGRNVFLEDSIISGCCLAFTLFVFSLYLLEKVCAAGKDLLWLKVVANCGKTYHSSCRGNFQFPQLATSLKGLATTGKKGVVA